MGGGDVKLLAGIGAFVGIKNIFWIIFLASMIGGITGLVKILSYKLSERRNRSDKTVIPFAPYLSIATFITLLFLV